MQIQNFISQSKRKSKAVANPTAFFLQPAADAA